ncbi:MAG: hypothetical protein ACFFCZ_00435 [Promethearchaeota archaeon]
MNQNKYRKGILQRTAKNSREVYKRSQNLLRSKEMIEKIKPDQLVTTPRFVLGKKGKIYLLTIPNIYGIYLLKFKELESTLEKSVQVPEHLCQFKEVLDNVYASEFDKCCTIPVGEQQFGTGRARGYFLLAGKTTLEAIDSPTSSLPFDSAQFLEILGKFEKDDDFLNRDSDNLGNSSIFINYTECW